MLIRLAAGAAAGASFSWGGGGVSTLDKTFSEPINSRKPPVMTRASREMRQLVARADPTTAATIRIRKARVVLLSASPSRALPSSPWVRP